MKRVVHLGFGVLVVSTLLYAQLVVYVQESVELNHMFTKAGEGIVYCYSDRSKTSGVGVKETSEGTWVATAQHKVDKDFPQASEIFVKVERARGAKVYRATEIIVPDERGLDLLLFFVPGLKLEYIFKKFRQPHRYEETWIFGFRGGANKVPGRAGFVTNYVTKPNFVFSTASVWYGNSGSPVLVRDGGCVGLAIGMANQSTDTLFISGEVVEEFIRKSLESQGK